jgi:hypothetical protein
MVEPAIVSFQHQAEKVMKHNKSLALIGLGTGALVIALALLPVLKNDFALGASFGIAIGLLVVSVSSVAKAKHASIKPAPTPKR